MLREAFLPPVTVEELDAMRTTEKHGKPKQVAGTRGWYDHSSEAVNFVIPLIITLIFAAIESIVLTAGRS
jgi:hypothetical protein